MGRTVRILAIGLVLGLLALPFYSGPVKAAALMLIDGGTAGAGVVGSEHVLSGSGFTAGDTLSITYDAQILTPNPSLGALTGTTFSANIVIPASPSGIIHTITVVGSPSGASASVGFNVTPQISVSATSALIGTSVTVTGSGYQNGETAISTTFDGTTVVGVDQTASATGAWTNTFAVPSISPGAHVIHAKGSAQVDASVNFTVIAPPRIGLSATRGNVGTQFSVNGSAFAPNETGITVNLGNNQIGSTTTANSAGSWTMQVTIPEIPAGIYSVSAFGNSTLAGAATAINFTVAASISINPQAGPAGTTVTVSGTGFGANESNVAIAFDGADQGTTIKADANGSWTNTFSVPVSAGGSHTVTAHGSKTLAASVQPLPFRVGSGISINKNSGPVGTTITVSGSGFAVSESNIAVYFDNAQVGTASANSSGNWSASVAVPASAGGDHTITARGRTTTVSSGTTFTVTPTLTVDKSSGSSGTTINLKGDGFAASEAGIILTYDGTRVGQPVTAGANGSWTASIQVPPSSSGTHLIGASGPTTQMVGSSDLSFKVAASVFLSQAVGFPGSALTVTGSGFAAGSTLQITFDDNPIFNVGAISADQSGNFNKTITIPVARAGSHVVKVIDAQNDSDSKTFTIDATPPAIPNPSLPVDGARQGFFGGIRPTFKWVSITDTRGEAYNKGVTYELQIDGNSDFSDPVVDLTGLTKTSVTLDASNSLPKGQYYWRVRAIDAASNQGEWSKVSTLTSGLVSPALFWVILIIVLAAAALSIYLFLIRGAIAARKRAVAPQVATEIVVPEVVNAEYRITEGEPARKALPWRLALPQAPASARGPRGVSAEDHARLRTALDFARSLPLAEPGPNTQWLLELAESASGNTASPELYSQIVNGEIEIKYHPSWMDHPSFLDLQSLLEGQPVLADLEGYVEAVNGSATDALFLLQDIYRNTSSEVGEDFFAKGGWEFISAVYSDGVNWYRGRFLREPSDKDYSIRPAAGSPADSFALFGEQNTSFPGRLIAVSSESEAARLRALHLKLRRTYRADERAKELARTVSSLDIQRKRILNAVSQLTRIGE